MDDSQLGIVRRSEWLDEIYSSKMKWAGNEVKFQNEVKQMFVFLAFGKTQILMFGQKSNIIMLILRLDDCCRKECQQ